MSSQSRWMIVFAGVVVSFITSSAAAVQGQLPHLVLFIADDMSWTDASIHGGCGVPMPNLDRLARDGMTFTHAFVNSPSCAPSRAALLTGLEPVRNGAMLNHARPRAGIKRWPAYFKELGYETAAIGKTAHYAQAPEYGFDHVSHFKYHEDDCIEAAVGFLASRKSAKPLCLIVGTNWPHVPWPDETSVDPAKVLFPPTLVDTLETRQARARYAQAVSFVDRDLGMVYDAARRHLGESVLFAFTADHGSQFPFGKWNLYDAGVRSPLVVAWPNQIKPGSVSGAMVNWTDILPTFLAAAGATSSPALDGASLLPVLLGKADSHRERLFFTHSGDGNMNRYPLRGVRTRDWKYIRNLDPAAEHHTHVNKGKAGSDGRNYFDSWIERAKIDPIAAAVVKRYHTRPAEELYDLASDPWELNNLAADPAHSARLAQLRADLDHWMAAQGDEGMKTEKEHWQTMNAPQRREP